MHVSVDGWGVRDGSSVRKIRNPKSERKPKAEWFDGTVSSTVGLLLAALGASFRRSDFGFRISELLSIFNFQT